MLFRNAVLVILTSTLACSNHTEAQKDTLETIRAWVIGIEEFHVAHGVFPRAESIDVLKTIVSPKVFTKRVDAWGNPIRVVSCPEAYVVWSAGRDNIPDSAVKFGAHEDPAGDLVWGDEGLWSWYVGPAGTGDADQELPFARVARECSEIGAEAGPVFPSTGNETVEVTVE